MRKEEEKGGGEELSEGGRDCRRWMGELRKGKGGGGGGEKM